MDVVARVRPPQLPVLVVGHRGDSQNAPENTLAAFALALEHGADLVEFDVHLTQDGDVAVIHDDKLDRTTEGTGEIARTPTAALADVSAGAWFDPRYTSERVPLLDEVLDLLKGRAVPMIEIKVKRKRSPDAGERVAQALARHGMQEQAVVICREPSRVAEVHAASPQTPLSYLTITKRQARGAVRLDGVRGIDCYWKSLSLSLVESMRQANAFITPWTVNRVRDMQRLFLLGLESVITDCPLTLRDQIEGFEFTRTQDLLDRFRSGNLDLDLELEELDAEDPELMAAAEEDPSGEILALD
jgi:glycerophosphoryl diester phosphodiesterase